MLKKGKIKANSSESEQFGSAQCGRPFLSFTPATGSSEPAAELFPSVLTQDNTRTAAQLWNHAVLRVTHQGQPNHGWKTHSTSGTQKNRFRLTAAPPTPGWVLDPEITNMAEFVTFALQDAQ